MWKAIFRSFLLLLAALPAAYALSIILRYTVNFHTGDEWDPDVVGVYIKALTHQLTFGDLLAQHNEHRLLVPRLFYLLLNHFTHWNNIAEDITGWVFVLLTSLGILWLIYKTDSDTLADPAPSRIPSPAVAGRWFVCNMLIFTTAQFENWVSGWGLANCLPGLLTIAAVVVAFGGARSWLQVGACMLLAAAASFSNGCGFTAWVAVGIVLAFSASWEEFRARQKMLAAWGAAFVICAALYAIHYHSPPHANAYTPTFFLVTMFIFCFFANTFFFGCSFPWDVGIPIAGAVLLALFLACLVYFFISWRAGRMELCRRMIVWFGIAGFSVGTAILGAVSRAGYGEANGIISRYVTFSIYLAVALINLAPMIFDDLHARYSGAWTKRLAQYPAILAAAIVVVEILAIPGALITIGQGKEDRLTGKGDLLLLNIVHNNPFVPNLVHANVPELIDEANALNNFGYLQPPLLTSANADLLRPADPNGFDAVQGKFDSVQRQTPTQGVASGWAIFPNQHRPADFVFLTYQDLDNHPVIFATARMGLPRQDVADTLQNPAYANCAWSTYIIPAQLPSYFQSVVVKAWAMDVTTGKALPLDGTARVNLPAR